MTSTTTALPACLNDVCECGLRLDNPIHVDGGPIFNHLATLHVCDLTCSAESWQAIAGCEPELAIVGSDPVVAACVSDDAAHMQQWHPKYRTLADILGDPSSDAAWLAMRDVLKEMTERRPFDYLIDNGEVELFHEYDGRFEPKRYEGVSVDELPRAIALAAWSAALQEAE